MDTMHSLQTNTLPGTLPRKYHPLEIWWWDLSSHARWFVGSITLATMAGVLGGVLA